MKIKDDDYKALCKFVHPVIAAHPNAEADYQAKGLSPKRLRWDLFWASNCKIGDGAGMSGDINLYSYMNDDHIDTALRRIMNEKKFHWAAETRTPSQKNGPSI